MTKSLNGHLTPAEKKFRGKVNRSRAVLYFERIWPRFWAIITIIALFLLVSLLDVWPMLSEYQHWSALAAFAVALAVAIAFVVSTPWPSRQAALRRLEERSDIHHRPASTYEDKISGEQNEGETSRIWQAHRERVRRDLDRLHVAPPLPRTDKFDLFGLRVVLAMSVVAALVLVGDAVRDRVWSAFHVMFTGNAAHIRLNAWITPPPYTRRPPMLIADDPHVNQFQETTYRRIYCGLRRFLELVDTRAVANPQKWAACIGGRDYPGTAALDVPENSSIFIRLSGNGDAELTLEYLDEHGRRIGSPVPETAEDRAEGGVNKLQGLVKRGTSQIRVLANGAELKRWPLNVIADKPPEIAFTNDMETTPRGAMKLFYSIADDYGIALAEARFERMPLLPGDPKTAWARPNFLRGPRPPLERPPKITLRIPPAGAKDPKTWSFHELDSHPWAGMPVRITLIARDHAGNEGSSGTKEIVLPERLFFNPLARAVLEQRRRLVFDPRYRDRVILALDALTLFPQDYIKDKTVYLGLRSVHHRLAANPGRQAISSAIEQLWHLALRIENGGGLSEAERRFQEIMDQLAKAIESGASQKEIEELMKQLRQAIAQFLNELIKQSQNRPQQPPQNPSESLNSQDLQRMLDNLAQMLRQGSKQTAQEMLSQLRDILDRLQSGRIVRRQNGQGQQMMQTMDRLGDLIGQQQQLMDDTFNAMRQDRLGQYGEPRQPGNGQKGQGKNTPQSPDALGQRQNELGRSLDNLQRQFGQLGMQPSNELDEARRSMENAARALREGRLAEATEQQSRALEQLRSGTKSMAEQMIQTMQPNKDVGRSGDTPLDPLGRPQRSEGPDLGTSVKIPDEIDAQRAREILELLRKRLGERFRPELELEYIERLLEQF